jgi:hypothetical protein
VIPEEETISSRFFSRNRQLNDGPRVRQLSKRGDVEPVQHDVSLHRPDHVPAHCLGSVKRELLRSSEVSDGEALLTIRAPGHRFAAPSICATADVEKKEDDGLHAAVGP